jgi:hypothetical protein
VNTQQSPLAAPAAAAPTTPQQPTTLEERAANVLAELRSEPTSQPASEGTTSSPPASLPSEAGSDAGEDPASARRARIAALNERQRARVDEKQRQAAGDKMARELETVRRRAEEAERMASQRLDVESLTEEQFFTAAERAKVTPQRLGEWLRERMTNPELAAREAAQKAIDPRIAALEAKLAQSEQTIQEFFAQQQAEKTRHAERQAAEEFFAFTRDNAGAAPYSARFLTQHGPNEFYKLAVKAASSVPEGVGPQAILDQIEENLNALASLYGSQESAPSKATAPPPRTAAAAKANTLSNAAASARTSVVEEDDWSSLDLDERARRLIASL